ncbi:hypothetical protein [Pseudomonas nunensis]|uniref:Apea-like HEPN domain-containing protein n=1 Tax=Pseudomonas nunensis TaxID=2961896 RepID=A0ABY5ENE9_9PSED|nr:hypothetical protein [Pseudomonas nunensis]MCL5228488.1 hypothetical protein [Pseudomonas nunensis]UTO16937.1 hypothetical protein NK667_11500 [Pseudomonas nunensis]
MRLTLSCMQCLQESGRLGGASHVEIRDDGCYTATCLNGHKTVTVLQQQKFEVLFEIGAHAILDGYYREAVSSFTSSLERFYEYTIRILLEKSSGSDNLFQAAWKNVSNMSERQLGAFIFLWAHNFKEPPALLPDNMIKFRNEVIHKGKIPSRDKALEYGDAVLDVLRPKLSKILEAFPEQVQSSSIRQIMASAGKADTPNSVSTMSINTILGQGNVEGPEKRLEEHLVLVDDMRTRLGNLQDYFNQMQAPQGPIMSPDEIRDFLGRKFPELVAEGRNDPDGWDFFLGAPQQEPNSNCIVRTVQHPQGGTQFELSVSSRLEGTEKMVMFSGNEDALRQVVDAQLRIYRDHL